jgi:ATP-dependent DNA helicase RecG
VIDEQKYSLDRLQCTALKGVGTKIATYLKKLNIVTVQDLLFHVPLRYEDRTVFKSISRLCLGDQVQVEGEIIHSTIQEGRRKSLLCRIQDKTGCLTLRFFYFTALQVNLFSRIGHRLHCYGEIRRGLVGYEMIHPQYNFLEDQKPISNDDKLTPIYSATEGLQQYSLRKLTDQALKLLEEGTQLNEYLSSAILEEFGLIDLVSAIKFVHRPPAHASQTLLHQGLHPAQQRLSFEELLAHQLSLSKIRLRTKLLQGPKIHTQGILVQRFLQHLPYQLTRAQERVAADILADIKRESPMLRLVQGDVGSGKTVVSAIAALHVIESGYQIALMVPTELLAEQHYATFMAWFAAINISVEWLTSSSRGKQRESILQKMISGDARIVIGTHALFQQDIVFKNLGLIIIDEQHRFGVDQRLALFHKGVAGNTTPHQLVMSATPIPRTLAMTVYADLDCSAIDELPPGRKPVKTIILLNSKRKQLIARVKENCLLGAQAYWVCTLIQESEILQCQAAEQIAQELTVDLPQLRIGLIHGRMKAKEKENIMMAFKNNEIKVLVATTVIEVGMDVPNASLMVIENSERLGLSQLHQLRGRVGRGSAISHCILLYQAPLSYHSRQRLAVMRNNNDGFVIAQKDLELRGPGEVLGTRQTGLLQLKIAHLTRDQHQLPKIQKAAKILLQDYPVEADLLIKRWLADNAKFSDV